MIICEPISEACSCKTAIHVKEEEEKNDNNKTTTTISDSELVICIRESHFLGCLLTAKAAAAAVK